MKSQGNSEQWIRTLKILEPAKLIRNILSKKQIYAARTSGQENNRLNEEQNTVIIDYSADQFVPLNNRYAKSSRGWYDPHEELKYQIEVERTRERARSEARKV